MKHGEHHLQRRLSGLGLDAGGDAAAVVPDGDDVSFQDLHLDVVAEAGHGLVDGVVHDLIHQMVQTRGALGTNIHTWAFPDRFQSLQHLNLFGTVCLDLFF